MKKFSAGYFIHPIAGRIEWGSTRNKNVRFCSAFPNEPQIILVSDCCPVLAKNITGFSLRRKDRKRIAWYAAEKGGVSYDMSDVRRFMEQEAKE